MLNLLKKKFKNLNPLFFLEIELGKNDYLINNNFSIADIIIGYTLSSANIVDLLKDNPGLQKYVQNLSKRDAFKKAFSSEESKEIKELKTQLKKMRSENDLLKGSIITLYHFAGSRSTRVLWFFEEIGLKKDVDYKIFDINGNWKFLKGDEFVKINPNRLLPALTDGKLNLFEAGSIINYYLRKFKDRHKLIPTTWNLDNWTRHHLYEYWCITTIDGKIVATIFGVVSKITNYFTKGLEKWWHNRVEPIICNHLGNNKYIQGDEFTATDLYLGFSLTFIKHNGILEKSNKKIQDYYDRILKRPAFLKANEGSFFNYGGEK